MGRREEGWETHSVDRVFDDENRDVDTSRQPGVLLTLEVGVLADAHDAGKGHGALIERLEEVGDDLLICVSISAIVDHLRWAKSLCLFPYHDRQHASIDQSSQTFRLGF